eukprot:GHRR01025731.1.p1 GENE.GHRR01025731.1~~GHRR01025731.1.p1  ORF type:complete len:300 (+),score=99.52 GHRR01025731.1:220-1119(+)
MAGDRDAKARQAEKEAAKAAKREAQKAKRAAKAEAKATKVGSAPGSVAGDDTSDQEQSITKSISQLSLNGNGNNSNDNIEDHGRSTTGVLASHPQSRDIQIDSFTLLFHGHELLADTRLELNYGRRYGLLGLNGCGKSCMLKALAAREVPIPEHIDMYLLDKEIEASDMTALEAVMEVDQEKLRLEAEAEELADQEMTPEVEARLVCRHWEPHASRHRQAARQKLQQQQHVNVFKHASCHPAAAKMCCSMLADSLSCSPQPATRWCLWWKTLSSFHASLLSSTVFDGHSLRLVLLLSAG